MKTVRVYDVTHIPGPNRVRVDKVQVDFYCNIDDIDWHERYITLARRYKSKDGLTRKEIVTVIPTDQFIIEIEED